MLDEAKRLNFVAYVAFGGEPLMRSDMIDILKHAHRLGFYTSLITNGTLLSEYAEEMAKAVDLTWVSLDYDSEYHDKMRRHQGAFANALKGIDKLKQAGGKIVINCVLSKLNTDAVTKMAKLSQKLEVNLAFDPMKILLGNEDYALTKKQHQQLFQEATELKENGYPIINSYEFLGHPANAMYSCVQPNIFLQVSEDGKVEPFWCQKTNKTLGDLRKQSLNEILHSHSFKEFEKTTHGCCLCKHSTTVETSTFYSVKQFFMNYNMYRWNRSYHKFVMDFILT
jgi:MoaA/NifB/PqqE/SkfB family radical SAM enzyme